jgi:hypothetical protein
MEGMAVGQKTKRHYREFFHHFFEFCLKFGIFSSSNWHCPNPVAALPSYLSRNRRIIFLTERHFVQHAVRSEQRVTLRKIKHHHG